MDNPESRIKKYYSYPELEFKTNRFGHYEDAIDGEQCFIKMFFCGKIGLAIGVYVAGHDWCVDRFYPQKILPGAFRVATKAFPPLMIGVTFAAVTCLATNVRGKDGYLNYIIGGASAGALTGGIYLKLFGTCLAAATGAGMAYLYKDSKICDYSFFMKDRYAFHTFTDKTLYINRKKTETD